MLENIYLVMLDNQIVGNALTQEQAFEVARNLLHNNPNVKTEQVFVKEFSFKKDLKIVDTQE